VLIVDDNPVNQRVLHEQVVRWGLHDYSVASGAQALVALHEARTSGAPYQIAILDYQLPEVNGEMLGRAIKADPTLRQTVLILRDSRSGPARRSRHHTGMSMLIYQASSRTPARCLGKPMASPPWGSSQLRSYNPILGAIP